MAVVARIRPRGCGQSSVQVSQLLAMLPHSAMISSDRGVIINGGQFTQNNYHGQASLGTRAPFDILMEAVAPNAFHDSGASFDKPKCHPRTRVKVLEIIMRWILGEDEDAKAGKQFMWLNGAAGCGKSAIAQSTVESCTGRRLPFASFFFKRSDPTRNHAGSLVATLAYQVYCAFPGTEVQRDILSAIQKDPLIFKKTLQLQFTSLIIQPLKTHFSKHLSTQNRVPFLIVIDGLDECTDRASQKAILTDLAESLLISNLYIPIFVASRPEHDIKLSFSSEYLKDMHTNFSLDLEHGRDADSDIRLYLFDRFAQIKDDFNKRTTGRKLVQDWPGDEVIETLVRKSSSQFIYAATVIRYVESTRHRPDHRLDVVLNLRPVNGDHPFTQLDSLYVMILESVLDIEKVLWVLSLYLIKGYLPHSSVIAKLLSCDEGEVEALFCDMGALVQVYEYGYHLSLNFLHASFREYLLDAARSKQFHIDMDYEIIRHITRMLQCLASCCSSSFNLISNSGTPILSFLKQLNPYDSPCRIDWHNTISLELRQSMLSFPLKEFLEHHTSTNMYPLLLEYFVTPFLKLLEDMVFNDPTSSYIQDHQLRILRPALLPQIQQYFNDDSQASVLVLFYHLGSHHFVPILESPSSSSYSWSSTPFYPGRDLNELDMLSMSRIWDNSSFTLRDNVYHRYLRQLLRDPCQTAKYALGPVMHGKAALFCFKELASMAPLLLPPPGKNIDIAPITYDAQDDYHPKLNFNSGKGAQQFWRFKYHWTWKPIDEELYFLLLGYIIFLLPRCGRSDALIAACEEHCRMSYIDQPDGFFPVRRRLLHAEIYRYLARV
ncbi:hypothetical protein CPC08DRAFT_704821 [Agrocybe pediades]|nr:hypothetical protein CPC08DRAFT_704821 [Agrocybe pediades]